MTVRRLKRVSNQGRGRTKVVRWVDRCDDPLYREDPPVKESALTGEERAKILVSAGGSLLRAAQGRHGEDCERLEKIYLELLEIAERWA